MESQANDPIEAQIRFVRIIDRELYLGDISDMVADKVNLKNHIQIQMNAHHRVIPEQRLFEMVFTIAYAKRLNQDSDQLETILRYTNSTVFEVVNFSEVIIALDGGQFTVPSDFLEMITGIVVATMRGLLIEKTANTHFRDLYIPLINPKEVSEYIFGNKEK